MNTYAFCPACYGIFQSRAFPSGANVVVSQSMEPCIFCGNIAIVESDLRVLKEFIVNVLRADAMASEDARAISNVLRRLAAKEVSLKEAEVELDEISPGLGKRIADAIRKKGGVVITVLLTTLGLYLAAQANRISAEANDISRKSLEFQIEQAAEKAVSQEHKPLLETKKYVPAKTSVNEARPHRPVHKNRKLRRAEKAKKRRGK